MRGNQCGVLLTMEFSGSIPAGAGEPGYEDFLSDYVEVYPRGCGGTNNKSLMKKEAEGLSPRVRGNHSLYVS